MGSPGRLPCKVVQEPGYAVMTRMLAKTYTTLKAADVPHEQAQSAAERRVISAAGRPLYDSLDDTQKSNFASVGGSAQSKAPSMSWVCFGGSAGCDFMPAGWDNAQNP